jgi:tRNA 5-methylaminomethyl-2-thiouridine biosynthesis bifunctional protein
VENRPPASLEFKPDNPAQARHVFLGGNDLPQRWQGKDRFVILETSFGLGLNFLTTWQGWQADPQRCRRLHFVSFEKHPCRAADLAIAQQAWPELAEFAAELQAHWPIQTSGMHRLYLANGQVILTLIFGDVTTQIRTLDASVDAFFLDGVSPASSPARWGLPVCKALARLAAPKATLASGCLAQSAGEALAAAEFDVARRPGFATGQEILVGRFRSQRPNRHQAPSERRAIVIGAGIAGSTAAHRLAAAGWQVTVLEQAATPGNGASSNLAGVLRPLPSADDNRLSRLTRAGFLATRALLATLPKVRWSACGVLHLAREPVHEAQQLRTIAALGLPPEMLQFIDQAEASRKTGWPVDSGGWWFPNGGWVQPPSLCQEALAAFPERIDLRCNVTVDRLERLKNTWQVLDAAGQLIAEAPIVIMASGVAATRFEQFAWLPQTSARGQVSHLPAEATPPLDVVVWKLGYLIPEVDGIRLIGASHLEGDEASAERLIEHRDNLAKINLALPGFTAGIDPASLHGRVGFRPMSPDRLPMVGPLPQAASAGSNTRLHNLPRHPGLWCLQGYGARGIVWSALMADLLLSRLEGEPLPLENDLVDALDPGRFLIKPARA